MKIIRFLHKHEDAAWGLLEDGVVRRLKDDPFEKITPVAKRIPFQSVKLLAPTRPSKIVMVGINYKDHAAEMGRAIPKEPLVFLKAPSSIINPGAVIRYPKIASRVDHEAELAVVIKRPTRHVSAKEVRRHILGYTCLNDVTERNFQKTDGQWARAKSFDTFCPLGPWIETELDPADLHISCRVNGVVKQSSRTSDLIFSVPKLISYISQVMTLWPGDVVSTGTPAGIGPLLPGDHVTVEIQGIGILENQVASAK